MYYGEHLWVQKRRCCTKNIGVKFLKDTFIASQVEWFIAKAEKP